MVPPTFGREVNPCVPVRRRGELLLFVDGGRDALGVACRLAR